MSDRLSRAIEELVDDARRGRGKISKAMLHEVCKEWGLREEFVARKFEESHGKSVSNFRVETASQKEKREKRNRSYQAKQLFEDVACFHSSDYLDMYNAMRGTRWRPTGLDLIFVGGRDLFDYGHVFDFIDQKYLKVITFGWGQISQFPRLYDCLSRQCTRDRP